VAQVFVAVLLPFAKRAAFPCIFTFWHTMSVLVKLCLMGFTLCAANRPEEEYGAGILATDNTLSGKAGIKHSSQKLRILVMTYNGGEGEATEETDELSEQVVDHSREILKEHLKKRIEAAGSPDVVMMATQELWRLHDHEALNLKDMLPPPQYIRMGRNCIGGITKPRFKLWKSRRVATSVEMFVKAGMEGLDTGAFEVSSDGNDDSDSSDDSDHTADNITRIIGEYASKAVSILSTDFEHVGCELTDSDKVNGVARSHTTVSGKAKGTKGAALLEVNLNFAGASVPFRSVGVHLDTKNFVEDSEKIGDWLGAAIKSTSNVASDPKTTGISIVAGDYNSRIYGKTCADIAINNAILKAANGPEALFRQEHIDQVCKGLVSNVGEGIAGTIPEPPKISNGSYYVPTYKLKPTTEQEVEQVADDILAEFPSSVMCEDEKTKDGTPYINMGVLDLFTVVYDPTKYAVKTEALTWDRTSYSDHALVTGIVEVTSSPSTSATTGDEGSKSFTCNSGMDLHILSESFNL
jgi:hypothetical protein